MENEVVKVKNIAEASKGKLKLIYVLGEGVIARIGIHDVAFFKYGHTITSYLQLPYDYMEADPDYPECTEVYSFFDEGFSFWVSRKDRNILHRMVCVSSFVFKGYELIGMKFDDFMELNLLRPEYVWYDVWFPGPGTNFRYYTNYYFCKYQFVFYVWRGKIRRVYLKDRFFRNKTYYMRNFDVVKYEE